MMSLFENKAHTEFLRTLNENQRDAVTAPLGPSLVLAGAGSGKTRVLTGRAVHLIRELHASPSSIAVMTFTNKAARELKERLTEYMEGSTDLPWAGTFHSFCVRILRQYGHIAGMSRDFTIYDEDDSQRVVNELLRERQIMREGITPRQIRSAISRIKNGSKMDHRTPVATIADEIYDEYRSRLSTANAYDFDDLLLIPLELMKQKDEFRELLQKKFDHLLIDEFQDTNQVQFDLACMIASPQNNVFAVGDDDQSIYSWRGANYRNVLDFGKKLENARIYRLEQNYRSTQPILDAANDVIAASTHRHEKTLWTKRKSGEKVTLRSFGRPADEANEIISLIDANRQKHGLSLKDFAILYRTNAISRYFEEVLVQHRIPYTVVGGLKFYERKEIKDFHRVFARNSQSDGRAGLVENFQRNCGGGWSHDHRAHHVCRALASAALRCRHGRQLVRWCSVRRAASKSNGVRRQNRVAARSSGRNDAFRNCGSRDERILP
jgi:DNA helicase-2/ATP-dependent DNA helicase PcrA